MESRPRFDVTWVSAAQYGYFQRFDPARGFAFDDRPYVIMTEHAKLDLCLYR